MIDLRLSKDARDLGVHTAALVVENEDERLKLATALGLGACQITMELALHLVRSRYQRQAGRSRRRGARYLGAGHPP